MWKKSLLGAAMAASLMGLGAAAQAQIYVEVAPPAPRYEVAPSPREGFVWSPGHYEYRGNQFVWTSGHWIEARPGYDYRAPRWVQRSDGDWYLSAGTWVRTDRIAQVDRDDDWYRDGRYHSRRFGPYGDLDRDGIQNRDDRDRDGDGVRNRYDDYPDDPRRS